MKIEPGAMPAEHLRLVRVLGRGGMGAVWEAEHLSLKTRVAVKFMLDRFASSGAETARFVREARAAAQVKSPHVAQVFDHGVTEDGTPYIVMEMLEGESLGARLERAGRLGLRETATILGQACRALGKAHAQGIVHRDVKPDNLFLVDQDGEPFVKVLDFGVAKHEGGDAAGMTSTGAVVGTPYYMSPEQMASSKHVDGRADLWSLGVVAYRCLTGELPFDGASIGAVCLAIERGRFAPASSRVPELGPAIDAFFGRALARAPDARFPTARDLGEALASLAEGREDVATLVGGSPRPAAGGPRASSSSPELDATVAATPEPRPAPRRPASDAADTFVPRGDDEPSIDAAPASTGTRESTLGPRRTDAAAARPAGTGSRLGLVMAGLAAGVVATIGFVATRTPAPATGSSAAPPPDPRTIAASATPLGGASAAPSASSPVVSPAPTPSAIASAAPSAEPPRSSAAQPPIPRAPRPPPVASSPPTNPAVNPGSLPRDRGF
jgi:serine/threonine-protein kinase